MSAHKLDWTRIARLLMMSRAIDSIEESRLYPQKKIAYQFSARGHELCQIILGSLLTHPHDAASAYYRSRPLLLTLGLSPEDAFAGPLGKSGGFSDGRDIGVVCNLPSSGGPTVLPMAGDVGSQYTPAAGWAAAIRYYSEVLQRKEYDGAISVVLGGEGSIATNGFWSALSMATTENLPLLFFVEDNGFAISVPAEKQTPGGDIVENLRSFRNLWISSGNGTIPEHAAELIPIAVQYVRETRSPALIRLRVARLSGHSGQDTQAYKGAELLEEERKQDPLEHLRRFLLSRGLSPASWDEMEAAVSAEAEEALARACERTEPDASKIAEHRFSPPSAVSRPTAPAEADSAIRINMGEAIRRTLAGELSRNPAMLVFGEDVAVKGGVHAVTAGLQQEYGEQRVFDTGLSEEGIIGRSVGMALAGLRPVPEIQFRKYADPATEQLNNCGTIRWRTAGRFSAPIVVRMAGGFSRRAGDPWHSVTGETVFVHAPGWSVLIPSNAADAAGLLRTALRGQDPCIFFEHRALLDAPSARRPYPGDDYELPLGKAAIVCEGEDLTLVSWGGMVERCEEAIKTVAASIELLDLRTIEPWDADAVIASVQKTQRCLIVHEDGLTAGFGAEIAATLADRAFHFLDAPIRRLAVCDIPIPYNPELMDAVLPSVGRIATELQALLDF
jgi:2-oxoisovalerate dehydrogenase E1 component